MIENKNQEFFYFKLRRGIFLHFLAWFAIFLALFGTLALLNQEVHGSVRGAIFVAFLFALSTALIFSIGSVILRKFLIQKGKKE